MNRPAPSLAVNEIRDYRRVNAELARLLDAGARHVRLTGVEGQRLLVSDLKGDWDAVVEVEGPAGPEFAAGLDAPDLLVVASAAADGAGRGLRAGRVAILERAGDGLGYEMAGGLIVSAGTTGHRAGLRMMGGLLLVLGTRGRLIGDRQAGGAIAVRGAIPTAPQHGRIGGWLGSLDDVDPTSDAAASARESLAAIDERLAASLPGRAGFSRP